MVDPIDRHEHETDEVDRKAGPQSKAAGSADSGALRSRTMIVMITATTPSEKASRRAFEKRSSVSATQLLLSRLTESENDPNEKGRSCPERPFHCRAHASSLGALEFLPSECYARNSFARTITQASSVTRGGRQ
jgi:hypothetical protein